MTEEKIREIVSKFTEEVKRIYGESLNGVILYGSCARGDFSHDSDIDIMVLLDVPAEDIPLARRKIVPVSNRLDLDYDVIVSPVLQNSDVYNKYLSASKFYQNVNEEGVRYA